MFQDDPPPGTAIETNNDIVEERFSRSIRARSRGQLGKRLSGDYGSSGPDDLFEVIFSDGNTYHVRRRFLDQVRL